ncbi:MAG: reverse transcriptase domain-containing protein [Pseudomonadota bacterium]
MLDSVVDPDLAQEKKWRRRICEDRTEVRKRRAKLRKAGAVGNLDGMANHREFLLTSPKAKRVAIADLMKRGKITGITNLDDMKGLADQIDVFAANTEPVKVSPKEKTSKLGHRIIFEFGIRHRVAQEMIRRVLDCQYTPRKFQVFNSGVPTTIVKALALVSSGYVYAAHLDIRDCFPSFKSKRLSEFLSLEEQVIENALTGQKMVLKPTHRLGAYPYSVQHLTEAARRGLPQGASTSPVVAHTCLSGLELPDTTLEHSFNYEDDFLVLAKSEAELDHKIAALKAAVGNLPGGHFVLVLKAQEHLANGIDFLGHRLSIINGQPVAEPTEENIQRLSKKLANIEQRSGAFSNAKGVVDLPALKQLTSDKLALLDGWMSAFGACAPITETWCSVEGMKEDAFTDLSKHGWDGSALPPPSSNAVRQSKKFYSYKWFS